MWWCRYKMMVYHLCVFHSVPHITVSLVNSYRCVAGCCMHSLHTKCAAEWQCKWSIMSSPVFVDSCVDGHNVQLFSHLNNWGCSCMITQDAVLCWKWTWVVRENVCRTIILTTVNWLQLMPGDETSDHLAVNNWGTGKFTHIVLMRTVDDVNDNIYIASAVIMRPNQTKPLTVTTHSYITTLWHVVMTHTVIS